MIYYYHDQKKNNLEIQEYIDKKKFKDIYVYENIKNEKSIEFDFVYFGSVIQYLEDYKEIFRNIFLKKLT